jgi:hypothetical protein
MPRLSENDYLHFRHYLHNVWQTNKSAFGLLTRTDQYYLHDYFRPSEELADAEALEHRAAVSQRRPSLPHCAGRALKHLAKPRQSLKTAPAHAVPAQRVRSGSDAAARNITVWPIYRPQPDTKKLARALLALARKMAEEDASNGNGKGQLPKV